MVVNSVPPETWSAEEAENQKELSYPLNNTWYTSRYAQAYHSTRTNGVFSADNNLALTPAGGYTVNLSRGLAWMQIEEFAGLVYVNRAPNGLEFNAPPPHGNLVRIDRLAIRFDVILNKVFAYYKIGTPGMGAPPLQRNTEGFELHTHEIEVRPGDLSITAARIRDLRLDENYCGIMRDSVTGIPTQQLYDNWLGFLEETRAEFYAWFETVKDTLGGDAVGNLMVLIQALQDHTSISSATAGALSLTEPNVDQAINALIDRTNAAQSAADAANTNANGRQPMLPTGTATQYRRGDNSLANRLASDQAFPFASGIITGFNRSSRIQRDEFGMVTLFVSFRPSTQAGTIAGWGTVGTLPVGFRPAQTHLVPGTGSLTGGSADIIAHNIVMQSSGAIQSVRAFPARTSAANHEGAAVSFTARFVATLPP